MTLKRVLLALLLTSTAFALQAGDTPEADIPALLDDVARAWREGDEAFLDRVLHARYIHTNTRGEVTDREFDLDEVRRGDPHFDTYRHADVQVIVHGDSAIASGRTSVSGRYGDTPFALELRFTDTFVRHGEGWQLAATHVTPLPAARR